MSISRAIATKRNNKFVIPCAGKMFRSNVSNKNKALCFVINKGYLQTDTYEEMIKYREYIDKGYDTIIRVGNIDRIILRNTKKIVYRQRYFFKNFKVLIDMCKFFGFTVEISEDFEITINNVMNCKDDLRYLEVYAKNQSETITQYLTNTCMIYINDFFKLNDVYSKLPQDINKLLDGKRSYLERAPFLVISYNIDKKESGFFICDKNFKDNRKFNVNLEHTLDKVDYGFTEENVKKDLKAGYFVQ